jgi:DNA-binding GntR family transcriptional regulator
MESSYVHGDVVSRGAAKDQFCDVLLRGADNPVLDAALRCVHSRIGIFRHYAFVDEQRVAVSMAELRRIVDAAARRRDPALARQYCEDHIRSAGQLAVTEYTSRSRMTDSATSARSS